MDGMRSDEAGLVSITVLSVTPARGGKLFALASVEVDIDGVRIAHLRNSRAACRSGRHRLVEITAEGMGVNHIVMDFAQDLGPKVGFPHLPGGRPGAGERWRGKMTCRDHCQRWAARICVCRRACSTLLVARVGGMTAAMPVHVAWCATSARLAGFAPYRRTPTRLELRLRTGWFAARS